MVFTMETNPKKRPKSRKILWIVLAVIIIILAILYWMSSLVQVKYGVYVGK
jgi:flagellar basal body-associated protein FliL